MQGIDKFQKDMKRLADESKLDCIKCKVYSDFDIVRNLILVRVIFTLKDGTEISLFTNRGL